MSVFLGFMIVILFLLIVRQDIKFIYLFRQVLSTFLCGPLSVWQG